LLDVGFNEIKALGRQQAEEKWSQGSCF